MPADMKKNLALFLLVPLLTFMIVPVAMVSAHQPNVALMVKCEDESSNYPTSVTLTIHGTQVSALCLPEDELPYSIECTALYLSQPAKFTINSVANGVLNHQTGTFGPHSGVVVGSRVGSGGETFVFWWMGPTSVGCPD